MKSQVEKYGDRDENVFDEDLCFSEGPVFGNKNRVNLVKELIVCVPDYYRDNC